MTAPTNPDQPLLEAVTRAYARYAQRASAWIGEYTAQGGQVHCASGCLHCCNFPIQVSLAEAMLTASQLSVAQLTAMSRHARAVIENARGSSDWNTYFQRHRTQVGYCPLLDRQSGACTAYAVRPARCRDTFSALSSHYCRAGTLEHLSRRERAEYNRLVATTPGTDGVSHYLAPLEDLGEPMWRAAAQAMRATWGLEVWGDFWLLTTLSQDGAFMSAIRAGQKKRAVARAKTLGLWHLEILRIE